MASIALNTNIAVAILNGKTAIIELLRQSDDIYLPITVSGELLFGAKTPLIAFVMKAATEHLLIAVFC